MAIFKVRTLLVLILVAGAGFSCISQDVTIPQLTTQFSHQSWTVRDGAPTGTVALAQTSDKYLWLGTPLGLYRFDGLVFEQFPSIAGMPGLPSNNVTALAADEAGGLWVGFAHGGISYLDHGKLDWPKSLPSNHGIAVGAINCCQGRSTWAIVGSQVLRYRDERWEDFGAQHGLPPEPYFALFFDRAGTIWASSRHHVYFLQKDSERFNTFPTATFSVTQFAQSQDGTIWISDGWRGVRPVSSQCTLPPIRLPGTAVMLIDQDNSLWVSQDYKGLLRTHPSVSGCNPLATESFTAQDGLSSNTTRAILRDADSNIWIASEQGIDRFRRRTFLPIRARPFRYYPAIADGGGGAVWVAAHGESLMREEAGTLTMFGPHHGSSPLATDWHGGVWLLDPWDHLLHHYDSEGIEAAQLAPPTGLDDIAAQNILVDSTSSLLVSFENRGLWRYANGWTHVQDPALPDETPTALFRTSQGHVVCGFSHDEVVEYSPQHSSTFGRSEGLSIGSVLTFAEHDGTLWVGGSEGIAYFADRHFRELRLRQEEFSRGVSGFAFGPAGDLWLNASAGVVLVSRKELQRSFRDVGYAANTILYGPADGVYGPPAQVKPTPSALADAGGRLWFATAGALAYLPPGSAAVQHAPPFPELQEIEVDGVGSWTEPLSPLRLKNADRIAFDYVGVDLSTPDKVTYRYRLVGEDGDWQYAGPNRRAVYSRLRPGTYDFRFAVSNGSDRWNEFASPLHIFVQPAFFQTKWFFVLCVVTVSGLLWLLYLLRISYLTSRMRDRLEQRSDERLRIARELHDTLLQSIHGLMLRFHFALETLGVDDPARPALVLAMERADDLIREGREQVQNLRTQPLNPLPFAGELRQIAAELRYDQPAQIEIGEYGPRRSLQPNVHRELCAICRESVINAIKHADARRIEVRVAYGLRTLEVTCQDNGVGFPTVNADKAVANRHWGIQGMRERASRIGAILNISSEQGHGTKVHVALRGRLAYIGTSVSRHLQRLLGYPEL